jgi:hypothetical protein
VAEGRARVEQQVGCGVAARAREEELALAAVVAV